MQLWRTDRPDHKCHLKPDKTEKALSDVVGEARALESACQTNKLIGDANKSIEENVNWVTKKAHKDMKLKREPGTCQWCGDRRGPHPWKDCPANGRTCMRCSGNDHFAQVCLEAPNQQSQTYQPSRGRGRGRGGPQANQRGSQYEHYSREADKRCISCHRDEKISISTESLHEHQAIQTPWTSRTRM